MSTLRLLSMMIASCAAIGVAHGYESTGLRNVERVVVDPNYYFVSSSPAGWGSTSCPNATWIYIPRTASHAKELFAMLLTAKAAGRQVHVQGDCVDTGGGNFYVLFNYVVMY